MGQSRWKYISIIKGLESRFKENVVIDMSLDDSLVDVFYYDMCRCLDSRFSEQEYIWYFLVKKRGASIDIPTLMEEVISISN